jgi:hypothetical protein
MKKKVVFIMGIGRSGSTLVELMIGSHSQAFSLGEISKLPKLVGKTEQNWTWTPPGSTFWQDKFTETELKQLASGLSDRRLHKYIPLKAEKIVREWIGQDRIFNPYTILFSKTQADILTDSSKTVHWISNKLKAREFRQGEIEPYLIYNVRDGRAVLNSYLRLKQNTVEEISYRWLRLLKQYQEFYNQFPEDKKVTVRYEELVSHPQQVVKSLCDWLNLEFTPDMVEYWKYDHHHIVGSRGTSALIAKYRGQKSRNLDSHGDYYQDPEFKIKLDLRWKNELSPENLQVFNSIAGDLNKPYEWD